MTKYHAKKILDDGILFDSLAEHRRFCELKLAQAAGEIYSLEVHKAYPLTVNGKLICKYVADFVYRESVGGRVVVEDVKGVATPVYRLKKKLMLAIHGIEIQEVKA